MIKTIVKTYQEVENDFEISEEQQNILDQRLADQKGNSDAGKDWKILKSELRRKFGV